MKIHVDTISKTPIYKQLVDSVKQAIKTGKIKPGDILPSMNDIAASEGISRETVKKAYSILAKDGTIVPKQGKGFFIAEKKTNNIIKVLVIFDKLSVYKQVVFKYHTDSLLLKEIVLYDYSGNVDTYTISNVKYDVAVDKSRFQF